MVDTPQTMPQMLAELADGQNKTLSAQFLRNLAVSVPRIFELYTTTSYANDAAAAAGGVPVGNAYLNGNFVMIRLT